MKLSKYTFLFDTENKESITHTILFQTPLSK